MPTVERGDASLYYEATGDVTEAVAFVPPVGLGAWAWGWQHDAVAGPHGAVVFDARGVGRSTGRPGPDGWRAETLVGDVEAVLSDAGVRRAHLVALGAGGLLALRHALDHGRVASLTLLGAAARGDAVDEAALATLLGGTDDAALAAGLSEAFLAAHPAVAEGIREWREAEDAAEATWRAQFDAVADLDLRDRLHEVTVPALVSHGTADRIVPVGAGRALAEGLPRGTFRPFEDAGHLVTVERSRPLNDALLAHVDGAP